MKKVLFAVGIALALQSASCEEEETEQECEIGDHKCEDNVAMWCAYGEGSTWWDPEVDCTETGETCIDGEAFGEPYAVCSSQEDDR